MTDQQDPRQPATDGIANATGGNLDLRQALRGDWMQTYTGRRFYPLDPQPEEIDPADIAHALSLLCRYGGHVDRFYSVAEHCVLMSEWVEPSHALAALLHDATEAYVVDVPRPLKRQLPGYREIEDAVWFAVAARFGLELNLPDEVKDADDRILLTERNALMARAERWYLDGVVAPLPVAVRGWSPVEAERRYLDRLALLTGPARAAGAREVNRRNDPAVIERDALRCAGRVFRVGVAEVMWRLGQEHPEFMPLMDAITRYNSAAGRRPAPPETPAPGYDSGTFSIGD